MLKLYPTVNKLIFNICFVVKEILIGYGNMGRLHARVMNKLGVLAAIIEPDKKSAINASEDYDVPVYSSIEEMPDSLNPDGAIIAVPTKYHKSVVENLLTSISGLKGILLEKPIASTLDESYEVQKFIEKYGIPILVGHIEVFNPVVSKFIELVNSGQFGKIRTISISRKGAVPVERLNSLSGVLEDLGVHDFDILTRLISGNISIYSTGIYKNNSLNSALISVKGSDFHGIIHLSREFAGKERKIVLECEKSTFHIDLIAQTIEIRALGNITSDKGMISIPHGPGSSIKVYGEPLLEEHLNFLDTLQSKSKPLVGIANGIKVMKIVEACKQSLEKNCPIEISL